MLYAEETPMGELKQAARNLGLQFPKKISKLDLLAMLNAEAQVAPELQNADPAFVNAMEGVIDAVAAHIAVQETAEGVQVPGGDLVVALHPETAADLEFDAPVNSEEVAEPVHPDPMPITRATSKGIKIEKDRPQRNGIKMPSAGGMCRAVWDYCSSVREAGMEPTAKSVKAHADSMGWNLNNASIEFYNWRKFWR